MACDKRAKKVAATSDLGLEDRISALPDSVLQYLLGFLPAHEAVRTCVLARHWCHQWRSVRRLRIDCDMPWSNEGFFKFMNRLLLLRAPGMALDEFEVSSKDPNSYPEVEEEIHIWIRHALMCKVRILSINVWITLDTPLISQHLRRLEVHYLVFRMDCLDFVTCPTLEVLHIKTCDLYCSRILSQSVKHLRIINSHFQDDIQVFISMPSLISLQLNNSGATPLLEFMPSLRTAFVKPSWRSGVDTCMKNDSGDDCCGNLCKLLWRG